MKELHGPYNFTGNDEPGFLVEGFEYPPCIMMGHTPPCYAEYAERYGFERFQEDLAYRFEFSQIGFDVANAPQIVHRIAERALRRHGAVIYSPRREEWDLEIERLHAVYNKSLAVLPEFAPIELAEFRAQAEALKPILDPELVFIAEVGGKVVGFTLGLPNVMEALIHANGLRYPWDYLRFARRRRDIHSASFKILAMDPEYWGHGLEVIMYLEMGKKMIARGYTWADGSLTNSNNPQTNKLAIHLGARVYRRYREYRLDL
jgi:GNAT superfamily N-acetyltransferase